MHPTSRRAFLLSIFLFLLVATAGGGEALAQSYITPAAGTPLRRDVLDAFRPRVEAHFGQPVVFKPSIFRVSSRWALVVAVAQRPDGSPVDYTRSPAYRKDPRGVREGVRDGTLFGGVVALLRAEGNGTWAVADLVYDAGDAPWSDYDTRFGVPKTMLRPPE